MSWKLVFVILLIAGPLCLWDANTKTKEREKIASFNTSVQGIIEGGRSTVEGSKEDNFKFRATFVVPPDNERYSQSYRVDKDFFNKRVNSTWVTEPEVTVVYDPTDPMNSYLEGSKLSMVPTWAGVLITMVGISGLLFRGSKD